MSKIMLIGDSHEKQRWCNDKIKDESPDIVIALGDYYDSFITTKDSVKATNDWLLEFIENPNHIALMGNHECAYRWPLVKRFWCSGNTMDKCEQINSVIKYEHWEKLKLFHFDGHYLYSHAGISKEHFFHVVNGITLNGINDLCNKAIECAKSGGAHPIIRAGWSRGGDEKQGGILWQDQQCETKPVNGWLQFCGHTPYKSINVPGRIKYVPNKKNPTGTIDCVDFSGLYYTTITDGTVEYKLTGCETYNTRQHKLQGEGNQGGKIIEYCKACGDPAPCHNTHRID